ncbi:BMC domain-containing protein [Roseospira marina]|uniref:BMC domain-containing protein n=1 Tax=Roseospira marina TaxID=140057 RepID=A0A5M6IFJ4_9PROT|nr:BMC domain-containing protein [Roseospira marina]KAA5607060.1 BMC domain-containing protein [Roseospira marina]MBB4312750.1 microcompartment protein CcmL/EutN [Roseospira marina]MBB5086477.1 microcompartment protein CcmL/EutN [Roseospira marina]
MAHPSLGLIETIGLAAAIEAADAAVKSANVTLVGYELTKGDGMTIVKVQGDVGAVKAAIAAAQAAAARINTVVSTRVIARPSDGIQGLVVTPETVGAQQPAPPAQAPAFRDDAPAPAAPPAQVAADPAPEPASDPAPESAAEVTPVDTPAPEPTEPSAASTDTAASDADGPSEPASPKDEPTKQAGASKAPDPTPSRPAKAGPVSNRPNRADGRNHGGHHTKSKPRPKA